MANEALSCPICGDASADGAALALHVATCSAAGAGDASAPAALPACPLCHHVYVEGTPGHEMTFHEHECRRVNDPPVPAAPSAASSKKGKRSRGGDAPAEALTPRVTLFPTFCFLCGQGGRGLLRCAGSCARACHAHCVDALQAPAVGEPLSAADKKAASESWRCAECTRGLHRCQRCGFLGHESAGMRKCGVPDCGFFFHAHCQPRGPAPLCPRHTCAACGAQEPDMRRCKSCVKCFAASHLRCPRAATATLATATTATLASTTPDQAVVSEAAALLGASNLHVCGAHAAGSVPPPAWTLRSPDATNSLRLRLAPGDVVLVLEFANALLPAPASPPLPTAANHWGVVVSAEEMEPRGRGEQLLSVRTFADERVLAVPNRYALRVAAAADFARPVDLLRHCLQRHVMAELQLHYVTADEDAGTTAGLLRASRRAFAARLAALHVSEQQAQAELERGLQHWRHFRALPGPRRYDGLGDAAPVYLFLDTRSAQTREAPSGGDAANGSADAGAAPGDADVDMADGSTSGSALRSTTGSGVGSTSANGLGAGPHASRSGGTNAQPREEAEALTDGEDALEDAAQTRVEPPNAGVVAVMEELEEPETHEAVDALSVAVDGVGREDEQPTASDAENVETAPDSQQDVERQVATSETTAKAVTVAVAVEEDEPLTEDTQEEVATQVAPIPQASLKRAVAATGTQDVSAAKRVKRHAPVQTPTSVRGLPTATSTTQDAISPLAATARNKPMAKSTVKPLTRKQKALAEMPALVLAELEQEAARYLERVDGASQTPRTPPTEPRDAEAFPWAARAARARETPVCRPSVMRSHRGARRADMVAVSRLLVSQDKRSVKCFIQTVAAGSEARVGSTPCPHRRPSPSGASPAVVRLDLLSLRSVRALERVVRVRLVDALADHARYTQEIFGMEAWQARRWLEQQHRKPVREQLPLALWTCAMDGSRRRVERPPPGLETQQWLCLCANMSHLTAVISLPRVASATSAGATQQPTRQATAVGSSAL